GGGFRRNPCGARHRDAGAGLEHGGEAGLRHALRGAWPPPSLAATSRDRALDQARFAGAGLLRAGTGRRERTTVPDAQVPHDANRRGGDRTAVEPRRGSPADARGYDTAKAVDRRASTALERSRRTHEPGGTEARAARVRGSVPGVDPALHAPPPRE